MTMRGAIAPLMMTMLLMITQQHMQVHAAVLEPLLTVWPAHVSATLAYVQHSSLFARLGASVGLASADASWHIETASNKGLAVAFAGDAELPLQTALHPLIRSIEITWTVGANATNETTVDRVFGAAAGALPGLYAQGVHLQVVVEKNITTIETVEIVEKVVTVNITNATTTDETNTTTTIEETNVTTVEEKTIITSHVQPLPLAEIEASLRAIWTELTLDASTTALAGFLAPSLCASTGFQVDPEAEIECLASSFPLPATKTPLAFANLTALPALQTLVDQRDASIAKVKPQLQTRLIALKIQPSQASELLETSLLTVWTTPAKRINSKQLTLKSISVAAVSTLYSQGASATFVPIVGENLIAARLQLHKTAIAPLLVNVSAAIQGEGFHRHVQIHAVPNNTWPEACGETVQVLAVVALPHTAYADLDELRRLERFQNLTVHSAEKHIEIERPSAVSSQHVVALEYSINRTDVTVDFEFPIHLRYQAPSKTAAYAGAALLAPQLFFSCQSNLAKTTAVHSPATNPTDKFISTWLRGSARGWRRIIPARPIEFATLAIPVGSLGQSSIVSILTLAMTFLAAALLSYIALTRIDPSLAVSTDQFQETVQRYLRLVQTYWVKYVAVLKATFASRAVATTAPDNEEPEALVATETDTDSQEQVISSTTQVETEEHLDTSEKSIETDVKVVKRVVKVQKRTSRTVKAAVKTTTEEAEHS